MDRTEIFEKLKQILRYTMTDADDVVNHATEESDLYTDLGLNSVGMLYIVIAIEEMFKVSFDDANFGDFTKVKDVIDYIAQRTST